MSEKKTWEELKKLVALDRDLREIEESITELLATIQNNEELEDLLDKSINAYKQDARNKKKLVDGEELAAQELKDKEKHIKETLEKTSNSKEYKAITKELRALGSKMIEQEDALMDAWSKLEQSEKKFAQELPEYEEKLEKVQGSTQASKEKVAAQKELFKTKKVARESYSLKIPKEALVQYNRMRNKVEDPIVHVIQNTCSSCFYNILKQDLLRLKHSEMVHCMNCYRFLYFEEEETPQPTEEKAQEKVETKTENNQSQP